jgi:Na+/H+-dicarboxylate symporter
MSQESAPPRGASQRKSFFELPLFVQIGAGLAVGLALGVVLGPRAQILDMPARLVLRMLGALAPALIFAAVVRVLIQTFLDRKTILRLTSLLLQNTLVAIFVGLGVANVLRPGAGAELGAAHVQHTQRPDILAQLLDNVPDSLVKPFVDGRVIGVVILAVLLGLAARKVASDERRTIQGLVDAGFSSLIVVLSWVLKLVPWAVLCKVAAVVGVNGFRPFLNLGWFVLAVLVALAVQVVYYLVRVRIGSWVHPAALIHAIRDPLVMAFSTASSTVTMPVTYDRLLHTVGLRERSASLGALVGSNFNNDGTALYEAMAALFVAQSLGVELSFGAQFLVVLTSVVASVGAAGIPEAGLVTMTLVFTAVHLPTDAIALLLAVDWFLDRARTTVNVFGDVSVACLLDGRSAPEKVPGGNALVVKMT